MYRKMIGVFTAVAAALLLVGVAWASGDDSRDASSSSIAGSASSEASSSVSVSSDVTSTSLDDNASTSTSIDDNSRTSISLVDTSSTSTTVDSTTSTSMDDGSTSTTQDDHETVPITTDPRTYDVNGSGTVSLQVVAGQLVLLEVGATSGWSLEVDKADGREIKVEFESGDSDAKFEAKLDDGELRVKIERD